jgi:glycosyltransferase involved in cell wall biosynthesis
MTTPAPRVSVIIPVYQRQADGVRALRSALAQDVADLEILVVDDGSPEAFVLPDDLVADPRVRLIRHAVNGGESAARNTGLGAARGAWIAYLDSDDEWLPGKLAGQLAFAEAAEARLPADTLAVTVTGYRRHDLATGATRDLMPRGSRGVTDFASGCWYGPGSTALFRPRVAAAVGPCDTRLARVQDYEWFLRFGLKGGVIQVAPLIGSIIHIGPKAPSAKLDASIAAVIADYVAPGGRSRLDGALRRRVKSYLALEQASSAYYGRRWGAFAWAMAVSLWNRPRLRVPLETWWMEQASADTGAAEGSRD